MNWMEFIAAIVRAVAWPAVVMVAFVLLHKPLAKLILRLSHVAAGGVVFDFAEAVEKVSKQANETPGLLAAPAARVPEEDPLLQLVSLSPRLAVVEAWRLVESSARRANAARETPVEKGRPLAGLDEIRVLQRDGVLDNATLDIMTRLRSLRNQAIHMDEFSIDTASAREYVQLAVALVQRIHEETP